MLSICNRSNQGKSLLLHIHQNRNHLFCGLSSSILRLHTKSRIRPQSLTLSFAFSGNSSVHLFDLALFCNSYQSNPFCLFLVFSQFLYRNLPETTSGPGPSSVNRISLKLLQFIHSDYYSVQRPTFSALS